MILDLIQFLIITQTFSAEIVYSFNTNNSNINEWKQYTSGQPCTLIVCEDINLINNKASKIFINLKPHYMITLQIEIWSYQSSLELLIDSISQIFPSKVPAVITCSGQPTFIYQITYSIPHYRKTLWISIVSQGLVSFTLSLEACPDQCEFCTDYDFQECIQWHLHFSTFTNYYIDTFEGWQSNLLPNKYQGYYICQQCQFVRFQNATKNSYLPSNIGGIRILFFYLIQNIQDLQISQQINLTLQQIGTHFFDSQPIYFEEQFLSLKFVQFVMLRDFELYYKVKIESFSYFLNPFVPGCNQLIKQTCFSCYDGWTYDEYSNQCIIDQLPPSPTRSEEEIDENNEEQNDENHEEVQEEFIFQEICDNHCLDCKNNVCTQCDIDFNLIEDNEKSKLFCSPKNQTCQKNCKDCLETDCLECVQGFEIVNGKCVGKCGDQLIVENEDCDDGNEIQYDGCYQCKYSCVLNCKDCLEGKCESCSEQYELEDGFCKIYNNSYEDNNNDPNDEFYQNQVESNWVCISDNKNYISQCSFIEYPIFVVEFKNYTHNKQYVQVRYAKYVDQDFFSVLSQEMNIQNISKKLYQIQMIQNQNMNFFPLDLQIEILTLLAHRPSLQIEIYYNQKISLMKTNFGKSRELSYAEDNFLKLFPLSFKYNLTLEFPQYLDETQMKYTNIFSNLTKRIISSLGCLSLISVLFGNSQLLILLFQILSQQNYLKYINCKYPLNLSIFFESFDILQFDEVLSRIRLNELTNLLFHQQTLVAFAKFKFYSLNADLLSNLLPYYFQIIIIILISISNLCLKRTIYQSIFTQKYFAKINDLNSYFQTCFFALVRLFYKFCLHILKIKANSNNLKQLLVINGWNFIFQILLYLKSINSFSVRDIYQIPLSVLILLLYIYLILHSYQSNQSVKKHQLLRKRYEIFVMAQQILLFVFLVFLQNFEMMQIGLISLLSTLKFFILCQNKKMFESSDWTVFIVVEGSVILFTLTSFLYLRDFDIFILESGKIVLGWFQMILLSLGTLVQLMFQIIKLIKKLYKKLKSYHCKKYPRISIQE